MTEHQPLTFIRVVDKSGKKKLRGWFNFVAFLFWECCLIGAFVENYEPVIFF